MFTFQLRFLIGILNKRFKLKLQLYNTSKLVKIYNYWQYMFGYLMSTKILFI